MNSSTIQKSKHSLKNSKIFYATPLSAAIASLLAFPVLAAPPATTFRENPDGFGHMLVMPYYTVQDGNATLLNIINTDVVIKIFKSKACFYIPRVKMKCLGA